MTRKSAEQRALESFIYQADFSGVTPDDGVSKTWTYTPQDSMTITVGPKQALQAALHIIGQLIRHPRTPVTWEMWSEPHPPYTFERD